MHMMYAAHLVAYMQETRKARHRKPNALLTISIRQPMKFMRLTSGLVSVSETSYPSRKTFGSECVMSLCPCSWTLETRDPYSQCR